MQTPRKETAPAAHVCPVCGLPQTKIQRLIGAATRGATIYVCAHADKCSVGVNLSKIANWSAV